MKTWLIAAVLIIAPIIGVIVIGPATMKQMVTDTQSWAAKTFPAPKPKRECQRRRG